MGLSTGNGPALCLAVDTDMLLTATYSSNTTPQWPVVSRMNANAITNDVGNLRNGNFHDMHFTYH